MCMLGCCGSLSVDSVAALGFGFGFASFYSM